MFAIEKADRSELMNDGEGNDTDLRNRKKKVDRDGLLKMSSGMVYCQILFPFSLYKRFN